MKRQIRERMEPYIQRIIAFKNAIEYTARCFIAKRMAAIQCRWLIFKRAWKRDEREWMISCKKVLDIIQKTYLIPYVLGIPLFLLLTLFISPYFFWLEVTWLLSLPVGSMIQLFKEYDLEFRQQY